MDAIEQIDLTAAAAQLMDLSVQYGVRIAGALALIIGVWILANWVSRALRYALEGTHADRTVASFLVLCCRWAIRAIGVTLCLGVFGVETTSLAALVGGLGVAIGIALKGNLSNLASGLLLLAFRPFKFDDWIAVEDVEGRVSQVSLLHTQLDTFDGARVWIPNASLLESCLVNFEHNPFRRVTIDIGVAYDSDLDQVTEVLRRVVDGLNDRASGREPLVAAIGFGGSSIDFKIGPWVPCRAFGPTRHALILAVKQAFDEAGIEIPFPQQDLHLRTVQPPPKVAAAS